MRIKNGITYNTVSDVAGKTGLSVSTVRRMIENGDLPEPTKYVNYGTQKPMATFSDKYITDAISLVESMKKDNLD